MRLVLNRDEVEVLVCEALEARAYAPIRNEITYMTDDGDLVTDFECHWVVPIEATIVEKMKVEN